MPLKDKKARQAYHAEYMKRKLAEDADFRKAHLGRVRKTQEKNGAAIREALQEFRAGGCRKCGEADPACLDAHHLNPKEKDFGVGGTAGGKKVSVAKLRQELAKCVCLCRNCHAKVHAGSLSL